MAAPNFANRTLYHGDNLDFLRGLNSETVHLIATDPPFNKGRDFHATPDSLASGAKFQDRWSWADDVEGEWIDQIQDDWPAVWEVIDAARAAWGDDMAAFLCFMGVRLIEMRRVLRANGSLYLHCDPTASHYLKALLDGVFGRRNFQNEIVWCYRGGGVPKTAFARRHDLILRYSKGKAVTFNVDNVRIPYSEDSAERLRYTARAFRSSGTYDTYRPNPRGKHPEDWWIMQPIMPSSKKRLGYPTQKPLPLYERIILASSNQGDIVLDPFAGCATTPIAAERLGRQWVAMDIWDGAHDIVLRPLGSRGPGRPGPRHRPPVHVRRRDLRYRSARPHRRRPGSRTVPASYRALRRTQRPTDEPRRKCTSICWRNTARSARAATAYSTIRATSNWTTTRRRSDGGLNHITNRILLCGPCNRLKSNQFTLSGLRRQNGKLGYMAKS